MFHTISVFGYYVEERAGNRNPVSYCCLPGAALVTTASRITWAAALSATNRPLAVDVICLTNVHATDPAIVTLDRNNEPFFKKSIAVNDSFQLTFPRPLLFNIGLNYITASVANAIQFGLIGNNV